MLRLSTSFYTAVAAAVLFAGSASFAQEGGLGGRITAAGTKLDQDVQACRPVDLGEAQHLLHEAALNQQRAAKAAKKGVPVDQAQVDADLANATALFNRAVAAHVGQCMRQAQGQGQPQTTPTPTPATTPTPAQGAGVGVGTSSAIEAATAKLDADIKACREIDLGEYQRLVAEAERNEKAAVKALSAGVPIDASKVLADRQRARALLERANAAAAAQKACPPKQEAQTEPPKTIGSLPSWARDMLNAHNAARSAVGAPPLQWSPVLQEHATARAGELAQARQLLHAPREGRGTERENVLSAPIGYSPGQMMNVWTRESGHFKPGLFPDVSDTGNWSDVAHYTQMIWPQTTEIGCGFVPGGGFNWLVCRYNPGGNKDGKPVLAADRQQSLPGLSLAESLGKNVTGRLGYEGRFNSDVTDHLLFGPLVLHLGEGGTPIVLDDGMEVSTDSPITAIINTLIDFGDEDSWSGFVGAGIRTTKAKQSSGLEESDVQPDVETKVEQPQLPSQEVYQPQPPAKLEDPM